MKTYRVYFGDACVPAVSVKTDRVESCTIVTTITGDNEVSLVVKHNFGA